ncbi:MAG: hypothetical protein HN590_15505, partial [Calditrichaeota bacterium]|nr:hypothetical protein [Calditrichota bacterium]
VINIVDVSDPANPVEIRSFNDATRINSVEIAGDICYVNDYYRDLYLFDVSDPSSPGEISRIENPSGHKIELDNDIVVSMRAESAALFDVSDPEVPDLIMIIPLAD